MLDDIVPAEFNSYFEPFLGSGAVFFRFAAGHRSYLSDIIRPLIETYSAIRDMPEMVAEIAQAWNVDVESYYQVRGLKPPEGSVEAAAQFVYLNKLCFNGLYRVNGSGGFNVPYGRPRSTNRVADMMHLKQVSDRLQGDVNLLTCDFEKSLLRCKAGDLVFLDPPYVAGHRSNGFVDYNAKIFNWNDQQRLADTFRTLDSKGVYVIQSNADHPTLRQMYEDFACLSMTRHSSMSGNAVSRGVSNELVILSSRAAREQGLA